MKRYRVCVDVTIRRVIDVLAADEHDAVNEAEYQATDGFINPREIKEISSEVVEDDGEF